MKKILFLSRSLGAGGAEKRMVTLARLLKARGCEPAMVCYGGNQFFAEELKRDGIPVTWLSEGGFFKKLLIVRKIIKREHYNVCISFLPTLNILNCLASIGKGYKVIIGESSASSQFEKFMGWKYVLRAYLEDVLAYLFSDAIVSNSDNALELRKARSRFLASKLITIHNPIVVQSSNKDYHIRKDGQLHIVVAASVQYIKNPMMLIEGLAMLDKKDKEQIALDWYGNIINEDLYNAVQEIVRKSQLESVVRFHDATNRIAEIMQESDIIALFSIAEGLPNAICEGMMLEKPIIMTRISDYVKMVDETNGFLCDANNSTTIRDAFLSALTYSDAALLDMGKSSKEKAMRFFDPDSIAKEWKDLIDSLSEK